MLRERILTALLLLALLVPAVLATSPWPFAALTLVMIAAAGWEWGRLCGLAPAGAVASGVALGAACAVCGPWALAVVVPAAAWAAVTVLWIVGATLALRAGPAGYAAWPALPRFVVGWLFIAAAWLALVAAKAHGLPFMASVFALVWAADIAAYFGGRRFGRRKLAPTISPGKTWEGVWSGLAGAGVLALVSRSAFPAGSASGDHLFNALGRLGPGFPLVLGALVALAVVGDLCESLVKRAAGMKDSSGLLPGHGGVLDRIDALLPVFPAALVFAG